MITAIFVMCLIQTVLWLTWCGMVAYTLWRKATQTKAIDTALSEFIQELKSKSDKASEASSESKLH